MKIAYSIKVSNTKHNLYLNLKKQIEEHQVITANYQTEIAKLMSSVTESQQVFNNHKQELDDAKSKLDSIRTEHSSAKNSHDDRERKRQEIERRIFDSEKAIAIFTNNLDNLKIRTRKIQKFFFESRAGGIQSAKRTE